LPSSWHLRNRSHCCQDHPLHHDSDKAGTFETRRTSLHADTRPLCFFMQSARMKRGVSAIPRRPSPRWTMVRRRPHTVHGLVGHLAARVLDRACVERGVARLARHARRRHLCLVNQELTGSRASFVPSSPPATDSAFPHSDPSSESETTAKYLHFYPSLVVCRYGRKGRPAALTPFPHIAPSLIVNASIPPPAPSPRPRASCRCPTLPKVPATRRPLSRRRQRP
jgi:hypothetical protein